jgi:penicillin G amidase
VASGRFLRTINLSIAVLLVALAVVVWWVAWRPLPQTSGAISLPIGGEATIARDRFDVPHITAASIEDAMVLQGFVTAQDRMWQMDALRRLAGGELAEIVGPVALDADREARRLRIHRVAEEQYRTLPPADRALLAAYARGVNYYIDTYRGRYPLEFTLLRYDPRPWSPVDCMLAGLQMYRILTESWKNDVRKFGMLEGGDPAKVNALFPARSGREGQPGSNAWALSGAHTASGKPILENDPHLEFSSPSAWYMIHLKAPGLNVIGVSLPGMPSVIVGHNERIAWGVTNLQFDVQDLYDEKLDPRTGRYLYNGHVEQAQADREFIRVKGAPTDELLVWVTRHGPVIYGEGSHYYALRWTLADVPFQFPFLDIDRAANWTDFTTALARFPGPGQNFVYADVDGNIGYHATGRLPIRANFDGTIPVDGSSGQFEWQGFIPFDNLPSVFNPARGRIVTANQNPFPVKYDYPVNGAFAAEYRSNQIRDLLSAREHWKPEDMLTVEKDVYSGFENFLARQVVAAYDRKRPAGAPLAEAVSVLRGWNGQMEIPLAAPMLARLVYEHVSDAFAQSASPNRWELYSYFITPSVIQTLLESGAKGWFADKDAMLLHALSQAIEDGAREQGSRVSGWNYGEFNALTVEQPVDTKIPLLGRYFNIGPIKMSGSPETVKQIRNRIGPSMHFVADLSNWDNSQNNITLGESGNILSRHYSDQWDTYYYGHSLPMQFTHVDAKEVLRVRPER